MAGNYPDGVTGGEDYFNQPNRPECPNCFAELDWEWLYCPWCGKRQRPEEWEDGERIGPQGYDCARDREVDLMLERMETGR